MERTARIIKKTIACMLIVMLLPIYALAANIPAKVTANKMKVYSTNKVNDRYYLGYLKKGTQFTVVATSGNWARITYNGRTGYALLSDMQRTDAATKIPAYTNRMTKLYAGPSTKSKVVNTLTTDYPVYIIGESGNYYHVMNYNGKGTGYVKKANLSPDKKNPFALSDSYKGKYSSGNSSTTMPKKVKSTQSFVSSAMGRKMYIEYIIYAAQSRLGCRYSSNPNNNTTFRNAGFVRACFGQLDFNLPGTIRSIGHNGNARFISRKNLQRGDVVCFDCEGNDDNIIDHIGIYLGNGYFIHASMTAGYVIVSEMDDGYYYKTFCWGRRYV